MKHALTLELFTGDGKLVNREGRGTRRVVHDTLFEALALVAVLTDREGHEDALVEMVIGGFEELVNLVAGRTAAHDV